MKLCSRFRQPAATALPRDASLETQRSGRDGRDSSEIDEGRVAGSLGFETTPKVVVIFAPFVQSLSILCLSKVTPLLLHTRIKTCVRDEKSKM